jgi:hypothetical protein
LKLLTHLFSVDYACMKRGQSSDTKAKRIVSFGMFSGNYAEWAFLLSF